MKTKSIAKLKAFANQIRQDIITMLYQAGSGHPAGALGMADIFTVLYFNILNHTPEKPHNPHRDRLILSCGHICPVWYATLARAGYFPLVHLKKLRKIDGALQGHPEINSLPGIENSGGPLGQGFSLALGMALAAKLNKESYQIFCITSDAEHNEGQVWETIMAAHKFGVNNLINIIDRNKIQIDGRTTEIMPLGDLRRKYQAFGWQVMEMDGHNYKQIIKTLTKARGVKKPVVVIAHTTPGKGVQFMENKYVWHGQAPNALETEAALIQLRHYN